VWDSSFDQHVPNRDLNSHIDVGRLVEFDGWVVIATTRGRIDPKKGALLVSVGLVNVVMANKRPLLRIQTIPEPPLLRPSMYSYLLLSGRTPCSLVLGTRLAACGHRLLRSAKTSICHLWSVLLMLVVQRGLSGARKRAPSLQCISSSLWQVPNKELVSSSKFNLLPFCC